MAEVLGKEGQELKVRTRPEQLLLLFTRQRWPGEGVLGIRLGQGLRIWNLRSERTLGDSK